MVVFFFDTFALLAILQKNPRYKKYIEHAGMVTTRLNLMELYFKLLELRCRKEALQAYNAFLPHAVEITDTAIQNGMKFRLQYPDEKRKGRYIFSYVDAIGYMLALELGMKFLTGDNDFQNLPIVEFVR